MVWPLFPAAIKMATRRRLGPGTGARLCDSATGLEPETERSHSSLSSVCPTATTGYASCAHGDPPPLEEPTACQLFCSPVLVRAETLENDRRLAARGGAEDANSQTRNAQGRWNEETTRRRQRRRRHSATPLGLAPGGNVDTGAAARLPGFKGSKSQLTKDAERSEAVDLDWVSLFVASRCVTDPLVAARTAGSPEAKPTAQSLQL
jgi:hypothetical protein